MALQLAAAYSALLKAAILSNCTTALDGEQLEGLCDSIAGVLVQMAADADIVFGATVAGIQTCAAPGAPTVAPVIPVTIKLT